MEHRIQGNPGTGNRFEETHVEHADHFYNQVGKVENNYATTIEITFNVNINLNGETVTRLFTKLTQRLPVAFRKLLRNNFDGEGNVSLTTYQLSGTSSDLAEALRFLRQELGDEVEADVRYHSRKNHFERNHITMLGAEEIADNESRF